MSMPGVNTINPSNESSVDEGLKEMSGRLLELGRKISPQGRLITLLEDRFPEKYVFPDPVFTEFFIEEEERDFAQTGGPIVEVLRRLRDINRQGRVLDVGSGWGVDTRIMHTFEELRNLSFFCLDRDPKILDTANRISTIRGYRIQPTIGDATKLPLDEGVIDTVVSRGVLRYLLGKTDKSGQNLFRRGYDEMLRVMKPNGILCACDVGNDGSMVVRGRNEEGEKPVETDSFSSFALENGYRYVDSPPDGMISLNPGEFTIVLSQQELQKNASIYFLYALIVHHDLVIPQNQIKSILNGENDVNDIDELYEIIKRFEARFTEQIEHLNVSSQEEYKRQVIKLISDLVGKDVKNVYNFILRKKQDE